MSIGIVSPDILSGEDPPKPLRLQRTSEVYQLRCWCCYATLEVARLILSDPERYVQNSPLCIKHAQMTISRLEKFFEDEGKTEQKISNFQQFELFADAA